MSAESLWHAIPHGTSENKLQVSAAVSPVSTAAKANDPQPAPVIWRNWPAGVVKLRYKLQYRKDASEQWKTTDLTLLSKPNESLWGLLFPEISGSDPQPAAPQPKTNNDLGSTTFAAAPLARNVFALYGAALLQQGLEAQMRSAGPSTNGKHPNLDHANAIKNSILETLKHVAIMSYPAVKPSDSDESPAGQTRRRFSDWVRSSLKNGNRAKGLMAERNLYRLSRRPYDNLAPGVFRGILNSIDDSILRDILAELPTPNDAVQGQLLGTAIFHGRCETAQLKPKAPCAPPQYNWAQKISLLGNYPNLLKELGLVLDFECADPSIPADGQVQVVPLQMDSSRIASQSSVTALEGNTFRPKVDAVLVNGALPLDNGEYELIEVDVDGAALKLLQTADSAARLDRYSSSGSSDSGSKPGESLPSLRGAGVGLFHNGHAGQTVRKLQTDQDRRTNLEQQKGEVVLQAGDLVRGYIPEVRKIDKAPSAKPRPWQQLTRRTEKFVIPGYDKDLSYPDTPAIMRWGATTASDAPGGQNASTDWHIHEVLMHWRGWSLSVPLPFNSLPQDPDSCKAADPFKMKLVSEIPDKEDAKLLPLRFGTAYELRLRTMDMACVPSSSRDDLPALQMQDPLCRFEPVAAPSVLVDSEINNKISPGEAVELLLVRSAEDESIDTGASEATRTIVPSRTTLEMAEMLGCFDNGISPFKAGSFDAVKLICHPADETHPEYGDFPKDSSGNAMYIVPTEEPPPGLYFPDPLADHLVTELEDMTRGGIRVKAFDRMPFYPDGSEQWPKAVRYRIELTKSDDLAWGVDSFTQRRFPPYLDEHVTRLSIGLPPAWKVILRLRSGISRKKLPLMAADRLLNHALNYLNNSPAVQALPNNGSQRIPDLLKQVASDIYSNPVDMLMPGRELTLVHAVAKPLLPPAITNLCAKRALSETRVRIGVQVAADRKSTGKLDIKAKWEEWTDDPELDELIKPAASAQVGTVDVPETHEPGESVKERVPIASSPNQNPAVYPFEQGFPDTIHRLVTYYPVATSRFQRFFPDNSDPDCFQRTGIGDDQRSVHVLSTRRPPAPEIAYVVPVFDWKGEKSGKHSYSSTRKGGGLRIYLRRPWFKSGQNEKLGVVLWGETAEQNNVAPASPSDSCAASTKESYTGNAGEARLRQHVTRWGADPEWSDTVKELAPTSAGFVPETYKDTTGTYEGGIVVHGLSLEEIEPDLGNAQASAATHSDNGAGGQIAAPVKYPVSLVTYDPQFDPQKKLWFCDVILSSVPAYSCFVRLATVRYQPYSLRHTECSHVSIAAFAQLPNNRCIVVSRSKQKHSIDIEGRGNRPGQSAISIKDSKKINEFDIIVEHARDDLEGPIHWIQDTQCTVPLAPSDDPEFLFKTTLCFQHPRGKKRLVIKEYEWKNADGGPVRRLVFADVLSLPDL
jgi:hypothetical protein